MELKNRIVRTAHGTTIGSREPGGYDLSDAVRGPAVKQPGKARITIMLDRDVVAAFRARASDTGGGYQTAINRALREHLASNELETTLRRVVREEMSQWTHAVNPSPNARP